MIINPSWSVAVNANQGRMKLHRVVFYFKHSVHHLVGGDKMTYCEFIMSKYFFKCTFNFEGNMPLNLSNSII